MENYEREYAYGPAKMAHQASCLGGEARSLHRFIGKRWRLEGEREHDRVGSPQTRVGLTGLCVRGHGFLRASVHAGRPIPAGHDVGAAGGVARHHADPRCRGDGALTLLVRWQKLMVRGQGWRTCGFGGPMRA